jgi:uncharacterized protein (TIGR03435 family)
MIIAFLIALFAAPSAHTTQQRFEVSSVTACPATTVTQSGESARFTLDAIRPAYMRIEPTRVGLVCVTVDAVIHMAYNGGQYGQRNAVGRDVIGGPSWIRSERYTIEGSADGAKNPDLRGAMMRSLLEDRFKLRVRRGVDDAPMYALKVARGGLRIKPMAESECAERAGKPLPCGTFANSMKGTLRIWDAVPATMKTIATLFDLDRQVIDKTGIKDRFAVHLETETAPPAPPTTTDVIKALEDQIGLTLVSTKGQRSWAKVESIEKPVLR